MLWLLPLALAERWGESGLVHLAQEAEEAWLRGGKTAADFLACLDAIPVFNLTNVQECCELLDLAEMGTFDPSLQVPEAVLACVQHQSPKVCVQGDAVRRADEDALVAAEQAAKKSTPPPADVTPAPVATRAPAAPSPTRAPERAKPVQHGPLDPIHKELEAAREETAAEADFPGADNVASTAASAVRRAPSLDTLSKLRDSVQGELDFAKDYTEKAAVEEAEGPFAALLRR
jgi:hypothetical protein